MTTVELLEWAVRLVHTSHDPPAASKCEWPFCKNALQKIAELKVNAPIHVWAFYDAPQEFRDLSENGGDEDWLAVVPASMSGTYINWLDYGPFGVSSIDKHVLADGRVVFIGTHA